jgi:hypothetical protein
VKFQQASQECHVLLPQRLVLLHGRVPFIQSQVLIHDDHRARGGNSPYRTVRTI